MLRQQDHASSSGRGISDWSTSCSCRWRRYLLSDESLAFDAGEDARQGAQQPAVVREPAAPCERKRQHPLSQRHLGKNSLDQIRRRRAHLPAEARWAKTSASTRKGVPLELFARVPRHLDVERALVDSAVERLEVVSYHRIERGVLGPMPFVRSRCGGREAHPSRFSERRAGLSTHACAYLTIVGRGGRHLRHGRFSVGDVPTTDWPQVTRYALPSPIHL